MAEISKITIPNPRAGESGQAATLTFDIKDATARAAIIAGFTYKVCTNAANTPYGVTWMSGSTLITGTLVASADTKGFYLVPSSNEGTKDIYDEYITVIVSETPTTTYAWERIGNTEIDFKDIAKYLDTTVTLTKDYALGESTTFTNSSSSVTFTGGTSDTFVKSYPGSTNKLVTTSIKGVGSDITFNAVGSATDYTATKTVFGTDTTASKVTTTSKTATNLVLGTSTTASKATAGTSVSVAKAAGSATSVSYVGNASTSSLLENATVSGETLIFGAVGVTQGSVTGTNGTQSITPYTFSDVTVPVVTSNTSVTFNAVGSATDVTVPVVTSNDSVTTTKVTTASKTAATSAANATVVATGKVASTDTNGDSVLVGLGTATTASAVTGIGTGTAGAQTITVGTNDKVNAVTDVSVAIINKQS